MRTHIDEWRGISRIVGALVLAGFLGAAATQAGERFSDPTRPPNLPPAAKAASSSAATRPLELQAILHAAGRRVAIINGRRLHENERIENAKIRSIEKDRVLLMRDGNEIELSLAPKSIKTAGSASKRLLSPSPHTPTTTPATIPTPMPQADTLGRRDGESAEGIDP